MLGGSTSLYSSGALVHTQHPLLSWHPLPALPAAVGPVWYSSKVRVLLTIRMRLALFAAIATISKCCQLSCCCRFIVVQQRSAIAVEDPLALSAFLERLVGLGDLEARIAAKAAEAQTVGLQCKTLAAEREK